MEVGKAESGKIVVLPGEAGETVDDDRELMQHEGKGLAQENQVCIVCYVARCSAEARAGWGR